MKIFLEISVAGVGEKSVIAETDDESTEAYSLLSAVAPQIRSLHAALRFYGSTIEKEKVNA